MNERLLSRLSPRFPPDAAVLHAGLDAETGRWVGPRQHQHGVHQTVQKLGGRCGTREEKLRQCHSSGVIPTHKDTWSIRSEILYSSQTHSQLIHTLIRGWTAPVQSCRTCLERVCAADRTGLALVTEGTSLYPIQTELRFMAVFVLGLLISSLCSMLIVLM